MPCSEGGAAVDLQVGATDTLPQDVACHTAVEAGVRDVHLETGKHWSVKSSCE